MFTSVPGRANAGRARVALQMTITPNTAKMLPTSISVTPQSMNSTYPPALPSFSSVCVVGCGAIGGWIGAGLASAGCQVSVFARGATLAALQQHGLRLGDTQYAVNASANAAELGVQDLVVIAVKAPALQGVARQIEPLIGPNTVVMTAMNGIPWWFFQTFGGALAGTRLQAIDATGAIDQAIPAASVSGNTSPLSMFSRS